MSPIPERLKHLDHQKKNITIVPPRPIKRPQASMIETVCRQHDQQILIVDDNSMNVEILHEFLKGDYQLTIATSGEEAIHIAVNSCPDFILLDVTLPGIDGYETCRVMKADPRLHRSVIIMVSAKAMPSEREQGYLAGADAYLTKPFNQKALFAALGH